MHGVDPPVPKQRQHLVDDEITALDQWRLARIAPRVSLPDEDLLEPDALLCRFVEGDVRLLLVIEEFTASFIVGQVTLRNSPSVSISRSAIFGRSR